jgi:hypothetical protein
MASREGGCRTGHGVQCCGGLGKGLDKGPGVGLGVGLGPRQGGGQWDPVQDRAWGWVGCWQDRLGSTHFGIPVNKIFLTLLPGNRVMKKSSRKLQEDIFRNTKPLPTNVEGDLEW